MNITITGCLGSGKSTICKELMKKGIEVVSAGTIFRDIAASKGMTVAELNEYAKTDKSIDDMLDERSTVLGDELDNTIFDCRLAWHFVRKSFKVFVITDPYESARRVFNDTNRTSESYGSIDEALDSLMERTGLEKDRFKTYYGIDYYDMRNYDLIIDSTMASPSQIAEEILCNFEEFKSSGFTHRILLNICELYPARRLEHLDKDKLTQATWKNSQDLKNSLKAHFIPPSILENRGYYILEDNIEEIIGAAKAGKVFFQVESINREEVLPDGIQFLSRSEYEAYEEYAGLRYNLYPTERKSKEPLPGLI